MLDRSFCLVSVFLNCERFDFSSLLHDLEKPLFFNRKGMFYMKKRYLILEDGTVFQGWAFGADETVTGELVFNTSDVGYV